jgi:hypothetical protein
VISTRQVLERLLAKGYKIAEIESQVKSFAGVIIFNGLVRMHTPA